MSHCLERTQANDMIICSSGAMRAGLCGCVCVKVYMCACRGGEGVAAVGGGGARAGGFLVTSQRGNKSRSCCHKTQPLRPAFKCCLYSQRAADTLQRGEREKEEERLGEREREGGGTEKRGGGRGGVSRPVAEGLILNVLQRRCLLSSLASPLTAPASKQDLSPLPPPDRKRKEGNGKGDGCLK